MQRIRLNQIVLRIVWNHGRHTSLHFSRLDGRKTTRAQQGVDRRISTAKVAVGLTRIHAVPNAHDLIAQALCNGFVERIAGLDEGFEGVTVEYLSPKVA